MRAFLGQERREWATPQSRAGGAGCACSSSPLFSLTGSAWQSFAERVVSLPDVASVEVDRRKGTAVVRQTPPIGGLDRFLERLSAALAAEVPHKTEAEQSRLFASLAGHRRFRLFRRGKRLSTWEIVHASPGHIRVRDAALRTSPAAAQRIRSDLMGQSGIRSFSISHYTGCVTVRFDPALDGDTILARLDEVVFDGGMTACQSLPRPTQWLFANATLALAVAGTFFYAPLASAPWSSWPVTSPPFKMRGGRFAGDRQLSPSCTRRLSAPRWPVAALSLRAL